MATFDLRYAMQELSSRVMKMVDIKPKVDIGFKNFFGEESLKTKGFNFWVRRQNRSVAVDINPLERGNIVSLNKSTNKFFIPPTFDEAVVYSAFDEFEVIMGMDDSRIDGQIYRSLVEKIAMELQLGVDKIARAEELMRAQALLTGIVTLKNGDNIDFKRKAPSLLAYNAATTGWDVATTDPELVIIAMIDFLVTEGMVNATTPLNLIAGASALSSFKNNPIRQKQGDIKDQVYMDLSTGTAIRGLTPQGYYAAGNYKVNLWGYSGYYENPTTKATEPYMDPKKILILPNSVPFKDVYCGTKGWSDVDGMSKSAKPRIIKAKRNFYKVRNIREVSEEIGVRSAVVPSLFEVDSVATAQVVL